MQYGLVAEGPTDFFVLEAALREVDRIARDHVDAEIEIAAARPAG